MRAALLSIPGRTRGPALQGAPEAGTWQPQGPAGRPSAPVSLAANKTRATAKLQHSADLSRSNPPSTHLPGVVGAPGAFRAGPPDPVSADWEFPQPSWSNHLPNPDPHQVSQSGGPVAEAMWNPRAQSSHTLQRLLLAPALPGLSLLFLPLLSQLSISLPLCPYSLLLPLFYDTFSFSVPLPPPLSPTHTPPHPPAPHPFLFLHSALPLFSWSLSELLSIGNNCSGAKARPGKPSWRKLNLLLRACHVFKG